MRIFYRAYLVLLTNKGRLLPHRRYTIGLSQVHRLCLLLGRNLSVVYNLEREKNKGIPRQVDVALGVPGRLRPWIFSTFGTTRVVGLQPNAPAAFIPGEIPGTHFQRLSPPQGTWVCR
jgi:hypothetical protein